MSTQLKKQAKVAPQLSFTSMPAGLLQRQCACGGTPGVDGECAECRKKRLALQSQSMQQARLSSVPPIVHNVLRSAGQPLDQATRSFMEPHFGHDFNQVRVHTDAQAAESAWAVNALAYTVGRDVVFGMGKYLPQTSRGRHLLAHELTHVLQQGQADSIGISPQALSISGPADPAEQEADTIAHQVVSGNISRGSLRNKTSPVLHRQTIGIRMPRGIRGLDPTEERMARSVYDRSLIYNTIYLSDALGARGRPFTTYVPVPLLGDTTVINIGPAAYRTPGSNRNLLIHELAHCWQSQHSIYPSQFMVSSIASQALGDDGAYCYIPGKAFGEYAAEQIAQQVENGEPAIVSHVASVSAGSIDFQNILSLSIPRWEKRGKPGVRC